MRISYYGHRYQFEVTDYKVKESQDLNQSNIQQLSHDLSRINMSDLSVDSPIKSCDKSVSFDDKRLNDSSISSPISSTPKSKQRNLDVFKTPEPPSKSHMRIDLYFFAISSQTTIVIEDDKLMEDKVVLDKIMFDQIGGLKSQMKTLQEMIQLPLSQPELFQSFGMLN